MKIYVECYNGKIKMAICHIDGKLGAMTPDLKPMDLPDVKSEFFLPFSVLYGGKGLTVAYSKAIEDYTKSLPEYQGSVKKYLQMLTEL